MATRFPVYSSRGIQIGFKVRSRDNCPCCGTPLTSQCKKVLGGLNESSSYGAIQATWIGLGTSKHFDYYKCHTCGTLVTTCYPHESLLSKLYKLMPPNMEEAVAEIDQYRNQLSYASGMLDILQDIDPQCLSSLCFLELGADRGLLVKAVSQALGHKVHYTVAIEPNQEVWPSLSSTLQRYSDQSHIYRSLDELTCTISQKSVKFNIIASIHVLDHTFDPATTLNKLESVLSEQGIFYIVVHNPNSLIARLLGSSWPPFCAQHPQLFTPLGIRYLVNNTSLRLIRQGRTINHFSLAMITKFLRCHLELFNYMKLRLPLGNRYYCFLKPKI